MGPSQGGNNRLNDKPRDPWLRKQWERAYGAGKGDGRRPLDREKFDAGYDRIFGKCSEHADHDESCIVCRRIRREQQLRGDPVKPIAKCNDPYCENGIVTDPHNGDLDRCPTCNPRSPDANSSGG